MLVILVFQLVMVNLHHLNNLVVVDDVLLEVVQVLEPLRVVMVVLVVAVMVMVVTLLPILVVEEVVLLHLDLQEMVLQVLLL